MLPLIWVGLAIVICTSALRAATSPRSRRWGRLATAALYIGAGGLVNAAFLLRGDDYAKFADASYIPFVRHTWRSLVVPNHELFIGALVVFELAVGVLVFGGGRRAQVGYLAAIGFHVALLSFGWGFYVWSVPMIGALLALLRAERRNMVPRLDDVAGQQRAVA